MEKLNFEYDEDFFGINNDEDFIDLEEYNKDKK